MEPKTYYYRDKVCKVIAQGTPYKVAWQVTRRCNLRCRQCYADARVSPGDLDHELTLEEGKGIMDELGAMGGCSLVVTGGEPLLRKDVLMIIEYAAKKGLAPKLATNATLVTPALAEQLRDCGAAQVHVSLDGADAASHDAIRGVPGAFARTRGGIAALRQAGLAVLIGVTIMRSNYGQILSIMELAADLGAAVFTFNDMEPCGRGAGELGAEDITAGEREKLYQEMHRRARELKGQIYVDKFDPTMWLRVVYENTPDEAGRAAVWELGEALGGCPAGRWVCLISPVGEVRPCAFLPIVAGNVREQSLTEIWRASPVLAGLRDPAGISGPCRRCRYFAICRGCRSRAYHYTGDYLASDPGCVYAAGDCPAVSPAASPANPPSDDRAAAGFFPERKEEARNGAEKRSARAVGG